MTTGRATSAGCRWHGSSWGLPWHPAPAERWAEVNGRPEGRSGCRPAALRPCAFTPRRPAGPPFGDRTAHPVGDRTAHPVGDRTGHPVGDRTGHPVGDRTGHPVGLRTGHPIDGRYGQAAAAGAAAADRPLLTYLFDPYCPWSYGYGRALSELFAFVGTRTDIEVVTLGGHVGTPITQAVPDIRAVERSTGARFGPGYAKALRQGDMALDSEAAAAGVIALLAAGPHLVSVLVPQVQRAFYWSGENLSRPETFAAIAGQFGLDGPAVGLFAGSSCAHQLAVDDFTLAEELGVDQGPQLLLSYRDQLVEMPGPGTTGHALISRFREVAGVGH